MDKTIKELADELQIPKEKVTYQVRKLHSNLYYKKNNITYLTSAGITAIEAVFKRKSPVEKPYNYTVDYTVSQLLKKDEQLAEKDKQIEQLQKLLDQQQQLHLQQQKQTQKLLEESQSKRKWWHFFRSSEQ